MARTQAVWGAGLNSPPILPSLTKAMLASNEVPVLTFVNGDRAGEQYVLSELEGSLIGRSPEADLVLRDDSVSRKHTRLFSANGALWLRDLGSRNGTRVNGTQVARYRLSSGDRLTIGASLFRLDWVNKASLRSAAHEDSKGRAMSGSLEDIPLTDVLQWLATSRKSGVLRVKGSREGSLTLRSGLVCGAKLEGLDIASPQRALLNMMSWNQGMFELTSGDDDASEDAEPISLEHVLMESARIQDEMQKIADSSPMPTEGVYLCFPEDVSWSEQPKEVLDTLQEIAKAQGSGLSWDDMLCVAKEDPLKLTQSVIEVRALGLLGFRGVDDGVTE